MTAAHVIASCVFFAIGISILIAASRIAAVQDALVDTERRLTRRIHNLERAANTRPHTTTVTDTTTLGGGVYCAECDHELLPLDPKDAP